MVNIRFYLFIVLIFYGCSKKSNNSNADYYIDFKEPSSTEIYLDEIADSINYIFLTYDQNNPVGKVVHFQTTQNFFFIVDQQNKLFIYKKNGELFNVINKTGRGPDEYIRIEDFTITSNEKIIHILDPENKKIIKYNILGKYLGSFHVEYYHATHLSALKDGNFCIYQSARFSDDCSNIFITDSLFNLKNQFYYEGDGEFLRNIPYLVDIEWYRFNKSTFFKEAFQNTVYKIDNNLVPEPYINIDFGNKGIPNYFFEDTKLYQSSSDKCYQLTGILESNKYIFLNVFYQNKSIHYLYIKPSNILINLENSNIINNIDFKANFWPSYVDECDIMYNIYYTEDLLKMIKAKDVPDTFKNMLELNSNPIIATVKLNAKKKLNVK